ncbi:DNA polymerase I - 3'-5' exonuclease and polymerase domains (PolA) [uncultured phage_MedDCM-OCT-S45-C4]|uniref:DNA-directed DNA polymerase n=1 Tax=uncultured phage_MedDCM-OCT-S45-C4 TaxID=2740801 RepID=A0A6S4PA91_9CAUD|nr:DNA polymerase I [uncultured phage_MedDCM-OCT-S45-C4]BAQ93990.1 DNA polymerase I - 3'-5' exonuclease and polymerase domains (PolA) [uncultured phage_MedDCM-OCT-S45-C4]
MRSLPPIPEWVALEHQVAQVLTQQELHGWNFDSEAAWKLASSLRTELEETYQLLRDKHPYVFGSEFTPKRNNKTSGYVEGCPFTKLKELNPTSRDHISWILQTFHGWKPTELTPTGKPIIDEVILKDIGTDVALAFLKCLDITKKLGMISEGGNAWLKLCTSANRIHHHCSVATNTHRCAHRRPNLAQVPSEHDYRQLFKASPGQVMVGADLSGIELRMLAHYLARYDAGRYADILLNGDIHQVNADKIGISRRQVKTVTYAFLYGAGDAKIGHSFDSSLNDSSAKRKGKEIRSAFVSAIDGLAELLASIKAAAEKGFILSIDKRKIAVDSPHKSLNYLLQSGAGVIAKRWMLINHETTKELCCSQLAFIHDELQFECKPTDAVALSASLVQSAEEAGKYYSLRLPISAEAKQGRDWSEVH